MDREAIKALCLGLVIEAGDLFFSSGEDESDDESSPEVSITGFTEKIVPLMSDVEFRKHFRVSRLTYENLLMLTGHLVSNEFNGTVGRTNVCSEKQLLVALWMLATPDSYRSIALKFGLARSVARECVLRFIDALIVINAEKHIIAWPNGDQAAEIAKAFYEKSKLPGVLGAIDGCHIPIKAPKENSGAYLNRKGFHSVVLQGICTSDLKFIDCEAGQAGAVHDACVLRRSEFHKSVLNDPASFPSDSHIVGDSAYPLLTNLMVPFKDGGNLSSQQRKFNVQLARARVCIERAFALLKGRFRRLKYVDMSRIDLIPKMIIACCILHNLCIDGCDVLDDDVIDEESATDTEQTGGPDLGPSTSVARQFAVAKRNLIADTL